MTTFALFLTAIGLAFSLGRMTAVGEARKVIDEALAKYEEVSAMLEAERARQDQVAAEIEGLRRLIGGLVK